MDHCSIAEKKSTIKNVVAKQLSKGTDLRSKEFLSSRCIALLLLVVLFLVCFIHCSPNLTWKHCYWICSVDSFSCSIPVIQVMLKAKLCRCLWANYRFQWQICFVFVRNDSASEMVVGCLGFLCLVGFFFVGIFFLMRQFPQVPYHFSYVLVLYVRGCTKCLQNGV